MMLKRLYTAMLSLMLVCSLCSTSLADAKQASAFYDRTADPITLDGWQDLFGKEILDTSNIGIVWTDKTVTKEVPANYPEFEDVHMLNDQENFLVTLSTMSATKSITGHETLPTDTVFVLDLSSSMYPGANPDTVDKMVEAVNSAIHRLLDLNPLNRVGVIIYFGRNVINVQSDDNHYVQMMPLATYHLLDSGDYLIRDGSTSAITGLSVNSALTARDGTYQYGSHTTPAIAGTYIQLGIEKAVDMMLAAEPTIPESAEFQAGATRLPILVLMSDGEPTAASAVYHDVDPGDGSQRYADTGNNATGERSPAESDFLTQLTAAYSRILIDAHYESTTPLFYTLGLGTSISYDVMDPQTTDQRHAASGADHQDYQHRTRRASSTGQHTNPPEIVNAKINHYWTQLIQNSSIDIDVLKNKNGGVTYADWEVTDISVSKVDGFPASIEQKYYVDRFFEAQTADKLSEAFDALVAEIILQSAYFPTHVENGEIGMSGYLEFHDEIGDMMEVKAVHGLVREAADNEGNNTNQDHFHYQGEGLAKYVQACIDKGGTQLAEVKVVMTKLLRTRFKLDEAEAEKAVDDILDKDQKMFYYNSDEDFSNCIYWYADENEQYLSLDLGTRERPANARYAMQSYWYADTASPAAMENYNSIIRIKEDLDTGKQCVMWSVPASMIPLVRYEVTLENDALENPGHITINYAASNPLRAVFEVGLRSGINKYNAAEYLTEAGYKPDGNGRWTFFSNQWDDENLTPRIDNIHESSNATAHFRPAVQNERYNFISDTLLYGLEDGAYVPYTGTDAPAERGGYYVAIPVFAVDDERDWNQADQARLTTRYLEIETGFGNAHKHEDGWYIQQGTATYPEAEHLVKAENTTNSIAYSFYETPRTAHDEGYVISILGNNGTFSFIPDTGMTITKVLAEGDATTPEEVFTFVITPASSITLADSYNVTYQDAQILPDGENVNVKTSNNTLTIKLNAGQTVYIPGLPTGSYVVEEQVYDANGAYTYEVSQVKIGGVVHAPAAASEVVVTDKQMIAVEYTNKKVDTGSIKIEKAINSTVEGVTLPADLAFSFEVDLGADNASKSFTLTNANNTTQTVAADESGKLTVPVNAGKPLIISGIPEDTAVTVTEIDIPAGYAIQGENPQTATVVEGQTATFIFTNVYDAADTFLDFSGVKSLYGRNLREGEFSFTLYAADEDYAIIGEIETVTNGADGIFAFTRLDYNAVGDHYYVVKEQPGTVNAMTYDRTEYRIHVSVTDVNAQLVAVATEASGASLRALNFHNIYDQADTLLVFRGTKTLYGRPLSTGEFSFTLYAADTAFNAGHAIETVSNGADGAFAFSPIVYSRVGTYCYVVRENRVPASYIISDAAEYQIQVDVWNNDGVLVAECSVHRMVGSDRTPVDLLTDGLTFTNHYVPGSVSVPLSGVKLYEGAPLTEGMFTFQLYAADEQFTPAATPLESVANAADGSFDFTPRTFSSAGVYRFVVVEDASAALQDVTYDPTVYRVTVTVTDNGSGHLTALTDIQTGDGLAADQLLFENFHYKVPQTGDHSGMEAWLALCLVSLAGILALVLMLRRRSRV